MARYSSGVTAKASTSSLHYSDDFRPGSSTNDFLRGRGGRHVMAKLQLSLIMGANDRSRPVLDGLVSPDGIDLTCTVAHPSEIFWRQLHFQEFDVSEMSLSSLLMAMAQGNRDWIGLPIFTSRRFFHTGAWVRADSGITSPAELKGKRVGVPEYQQTA